ncbi:UNVERIFIED_CONTAM: hypothetical protein GTU68_055214 [Idotea baltica]|nr:hypothetical protein [Idotea baltica]
MAIEQDIIVAVAARDDSKLCISNVNSKYESFECDIKNYVIGDIKFKWYKYILCGLEGVKEAQSKDSLRGLSLSVSGNVPPSAGLSSSSALVCASALMTSHFCRAGHSLHALAELSAQAERYIGTEGGGMDQAASFLSKAGSAQLIEFNPLRCTPVQLPEGALFVVANSLVEKNKAAGSDFNTRVVECRLACRLMAKKAGIPMSKNMPLGDLQKTLGKSFSEMVESVKEILHPQPYSKQEVCQLLNMSVSQLEKV